MRNAFQRGKQIARWLTAIEQHLRDIFNEEDSNRVMHKAKEIIREGGFNRPLRASSTG